MTTCAAASDRTRRRSVEFSAFNVLPDRLTFGQVADQLDKFLLDNKAAVRINDAGREHGQIRAFNNRSFDVNKSVPTVVMRTRISGASRV
jgi:hypothetical protein